MLDVGELKIMRLRNEVSAHTKIIMFKKRKNHVAPEM
jgi:hypothetical protein